MWEMIEKNDMNIFMLRSLSVTGFACTTHQYLCKDVAQGSGEVGNHLG